MGARALLARQRPPLPASGAFGPGVPPGLGVLPEGSTRCGGKHPRKIRIFPLFEMGISLSTRRNVKWHSE